MNESSENNKIDTSNPDVVKQYISALDTSGNLDHITAIVKAFNEGRQSSRKKKQNLNVSAPIPSMEMGKLAGKEEMKEKLLGDHQSIMIEEEKNEKKEVSFNIVWVLKTLFEMNMNMIIADKVIESLTEEERELSSKQTLLNMVLDRILSFEENVEVERDAKKREQMMSLSTRPISMQDLS